MPSSATKRIPENPPAASKRNRFTFIVVVRFLVLLVPPLALPGALGAQPKEWLAQDLFSVSFPTENEGWVCGAGAIWDLNENSYGQRPMGWTSVDAGGLPVSAGILRYEEVVAGAVNHAIRFTLSCTTDGYVPPATHWAVPGGCDPDGAPPMGLRVRLKASFDVSGYRPYVQTILRAMQRYGMILADNGSSFYFQGDQDPSWGADDLDELKSISSTEFEVVGPVPEIQP